jgi:hypothetical protein
MEGAGMLGELFSGGFALLFLLALYFIPAVVAVKRNHKNSKAIIALDLLLGWTALGWIAALVWSLTNNVDESKADTTEPTGT